MAFVTITYELRGQNPCLMEKNKRGKRGGRTIFLSSKRLMFFISFSTNLRCKFIFVVPKCIVLYVVLLNLISFLLFMSHGCLSLSL